MGVMPGYQETELGVIPKDWRMRPLSELAIIEMGQSPLGKFYNRNREGIPLIQGNADLVERRSIKRVWTTSAPKTCQEGDVLLTVRAPVGYTAVATEDVCLGRGVCALRNPTISRDFLFHALVYAEPNWLSLQQGSTFTSANSRQVSGFLIATPTRVEEQLAIAEVLNDVDSLIESLDLLITKKQDIKQGALRQLLTGRTRLPGFRKDWNTRRFSDIFDLLRTANNPRADLSGQGTVGYVHYGDIHTTHGSTLNLDEVRIPLIDAQLIGRASRVQDGDLLMVDASEDYLGVGKSVEVFGVGSREVVGGLHTFLLRSNPADLVDGFKRYIQYIPGIRFQLEGLVTGISVYGLSKSNLQSVVISLPDPSEQRAIAAVLSDMDSEIEGLENRRNKSNLLKQGMMSELLTGKTRL
jgi:type I restriction enzyme S subunit